jgi:hypothetical protein
MSKFDKVVNEIKSFGNYLIPYNCPKVTPFEEAEINVLKSTEITVDGLGIVIFYSKSDWNTHFVTTLQITGRYIPFLPFSLVCKIGKRILGEKYLSYVDLMIESKKVYCWTLVSDKDNNPIQSPYKDEVSDCVYEGLSYTSLKSSKVNFY